MTEQGTPSGPGGGTPPRKEGWYRDRNTGKRRFWNGVAWSDLPSVITPFVYEPARTVAPIPPPPPRAAPPKPIGRRAKVIGLAVAAAVIVLAIVGALELSNSGSERASTSGTVPSASFPPDTDAAPSSPTSAPPLGSTTTISPATAVGSPGDTSPSTTSPTASPSSTSPEVPNPDGNVAIIGDSITALGRTDLIHALHDYHLYIDAVGKTTMADHLANIQQIAGDGQPWDWVIELGTNDALPEPSNPNWAADFANEVNAVQAQRCVVFVTVNPKAGAIATEIDGAIASAVASHPNFHSLDWGDIEFRRAQWLESDGIHPTKSGLAELTKLEHRAIRQCQGQ